MTYQRACEINKLNPTKIEANKRTGAFIQRGLVNGCALRFRVAAQILVNGHAD